MATAAANCRLSTVTFTGCHRLFSDRPRPNFLFKSLHNQLSQIPVGLRTKKLLCISAVEQKSSDENPFSNTVRVDLKDELTVSDDLEEQKVETINLPNEPYLEAVVKVYCTHADPEYSLPWQKQRQYKSTGSAFVIGDRKLLTNAHCVKHSTHIKVKRRGDSKKYVAEIVAKGVECDLALLSVESEEFWEGTELLHFGCLPNLQDAVRVVGYPVGGEGISVTKGIVSRIEVTPYRSSKLISIQIDAAINPGNSGGPALNAQGECIGVAFMTYGSYRVESIGYLIPIEVVSHFVQDYQRNGKYTGFPNLGVKLQKKENPALRASLNVSSKEGMLVRAVEPTSGAGGVLMKGDIIQSFDNVPIACNGTVPFRSSERINFSYLISSRFTGDIAELGIIRGGQCMKVEVTLDTEVHLVPKYFEGDLPYLIVAGLVFTPLSASLLSEEDFPLTTEAKAKYTMASFKGEQIVILLQVLENDVNSGYEDISNREVLKLNGTRIKNIDHLAHLVDSCKDKYLSFELEDGSLLVLERESALASSKSILKDYGIPSERSDALGIGMWE